MEHSPVLNRRAFLQRTLPLPATNTGIRNQAGLEPFTPSPEQPWDQRRARHLAHRTGFGAPLDLIETYLNTGPQATVNAIVNKARDMALPDPPSWVDDGPPAYGSPASETQAYNKLNGERRNEYRAGWMQDMFTYGLRDKMALLWSNHFVAELGSYALAPYAVQYLTTLRTHALGNFKTLTHEIGLLPSMLHYLNGRQNHKNGPNENYARELLELFTMGITNADGEPNYTQEDIREIARALTGWRNNRPGLFSYFQQNRFDTGQKTFFGRTGNFGYDDVIDIIFEERAEAIAYFVCTKIYRFFVNHDVDTDIVQQMATQFIESDFRIMPVVRTLLRSAHFFDDSVIGVKIKSPIELLQFLVHDLDMNIPEEGYLQLFRYARNLDQPPFDPPDVAGWQENHSWLTTSTLPQRWNYGQILLNGNFVFDKYDPLPFAGKLSAPNDPYAITREITDFFLPQPLSDEDYEFLTEVLLDGIPDYEWNIEIAGAGNRLLNFLKYLVQLPEYQLT